MSTIFLDIFLSKKGRINLDALSNVVFPIPIPTNKILPWVNGNPDDAKSMFSESAAEILNHLQNIEARV